MASGINPNSTALGVGLNHHGGRHRGAYANRLAGRLLNISGKNDLLAEIDAIESELREIDSDIDNSPLDDNGKKRDTVRECATSN